MCAAPLMVSVSVSRILGGVSSCPEAGEAGEREICYLPACAPREAETIESSEEIFGELKLDQVKHVLSVPVSETATKTNTSGARTKRQRSALDNRL